MGRYSFVRQANAPVALLEMDHDETSGQVQTLRREQRTTRSVVGAKGFSAINLINNFRKKVIQYLAASLRFGTPFFVL